MGQSNYIFIRNAASLLAKKIAIIALRKAIGNMNVYGARAGGTVLKISKGSVIFQSRRNLLNGKKTTSAFAETSFNVIGPHIRQS